MFYRFLGDLQEREIPNTRGLYTITIDGVVYNRNREPKLKVVNELGYEVVDIRYNNIKQPMAVAYLMMIAFKPTHLPVEQWGLLNVLFADGNKLNTHPSNLVCKYPQRLECLQHPGYYVIPCYSRYAINNDLNVIEIESKNSIKARSYKRGYFYFTLKQDFGLARAVSRHRVVGFTFLDYRENIDSQEVNHIDGVPGNDFPNNLEIISPSQNVRHAVMNKLIKTIPVKVILPSGEEVHFPSYNAYIERYPTSKHRAYNAFRRGLTYDAGDHIAHCLGDIGTFNRPRPRAVLVRYPLEDKVVRYKSYKQAAKGLSVSRNELSRRLSAPNMPLFTDLTQTKFEDDLTPWREIDSEREQLISTTDMIPVQVRDSFTGDIKEYENVSKAALAEGVTSACVLNRISDNGRIVRANGKQYRYKKSLESWYIPVDPRREMLASGRSDKVLVKNIFNGELLEFNSKLAFCVFAGVSSSAIKKPPKVIGRKWMLKDLGDPEDFPTVDDPILAIDRTYGTNHVQIRNSKTGEIVMYPNANEAARALGIGTTTMDQRVRSEGLKVYNDGYQYKYYRDPTPSTWL